MVDYQSEIALNSKEEGDDDDHFINILETRVHVIPTSKIHLERKLGWRMYDVIQIPALKGQGLRK